LDHVITVNRVAADAVEAIAVVVIITAVITIEDLIIAAPAQQTGGPIKNKHANAHT